MILWKTINLKENEEVPLNRPQVPSFDYSVRNYCSDIDTEPFRYFSAVCSVHVVKNLMGKIKQVGHISKFSKRDMAQCDTR